jgi:hypothetical protein
VCKSCIEEGLLGGVWDQEAGEAITKIPVQVTWQPVVPQWLCISITPSPPFTWRPESWISCFFAHAASGCHFQALSALEGGEGRGGKSPVPASGLPGDARTQGARRRQWEAGRGQPTDCPQEAGSCSPGVLSVGLH